MTARSLLLSACVGLGFVGFAGERAAGQAPDPRYRLDLHLTTGSTQLRQGLDFFSVPGHDPPASIHGFSYGVCLGTGMQPLSVVPGSAIATLNFGYPPAFFVPNVAPNPGGGFTLGCIIDHTYTYQLQPGLNRELVVTTMSIAPSANLSANYCDTLGTPPVAVLLVGSTGTSYYPSMLPLNVVAPPPPPPPSVFGFTRGDCNGSSFVSIPDVIALLLILFPPPGVPTAAHCADACDANDDGSISLADAIITLHALFGMPPVMLPPPSTCSDDPTDQDALGCASPALCPPAP